MTTPDRFQTHLLPKMSEELNELHSVIATPAYAIGDLVRLLEADREAVKRFVCIIAPGKQTAAGKKRWFTLHEVLSIYLCWNLALRLRLGVELLAEAFMDLNPEEIQPPLEVDCRNPEDEEIAALRFSSDEMNRVVFDILLTLYPLTRILVTPPHRPLFLHVRPGSEQSGKTLCEITDGEMMALDILDRVERSWNAPPRLEAVIRINATIHVEYALSRLRETDQNIGALPLAHPPAPEHQPEINDNARLLFREENALIDVLRTISAQSKAEITVRNGIPTAVEYQVFHPAKQTRPASLLDEPHTMSVTSIPDRITRKPQGYIQRIKIDFMNADDRKDGLEPPRS